VPVSQMVLIIAVIVLTLTAKVINSVSWLIRGF